MSSSLRELKFSPVWWLTRPGSEGVAAPLLSPDSPYVRKMNCPAVVAAI